ncbi:MAG: histidine kinase N-terminal 7TM domain-containing protein [Chloroflexota bacterium]|nr:histidine kinase N-terminal 7TM domain-containing protein [Chloroflexota bacterium]
MWQYTPLIFPLLVAAAISAGLAFYSWKRRLAVGATSFALLMLAVAVWSLCYALRLSHMDLPGKIFWSKIRYTGIVAVPVTWFTFVLQYTGREKWLTPRNVIGLATIPLITLLLALTNEAHHSIWSDINLVPSGPVLAWDASHGVAYWVYAVYTYSLFFISLCLLAQAFVRSSRPYRGQAGSLIIGVLVPLVGDVLSTFNLIPSPLDLTPFAFTITGLMTAWAIFRLRLFDIVPVARSAVVDSISDGVIVLDMQNRIVDINPAAQNILDRQASEVVGQSVALLLADRPDLMERYGDVSRARTEITLGEGTSRRNYDLLISPLHNQQGCISGRLIVMHDITERKRAEASLVAQKQLFESLVAMARATAKNTSLEATLQSALNMAAALTGAEHGSMFLVDGTGSVTHSVLAHYEMPPERQQEVIESVMEDGLAGWVVLHRQPALVYDTSLDDRWLELPDMPYTVRSALATPIVSGSAVLGALTLTHSEPNHFSTEHAYMIQSSADQMTLAVRNAQMYDEQRRLADRQTTLYEALRTVGEHLDPETIAHAAVAAVARLTGWPAVAILLPDDTTSRLVIRARAGAIAVAEGQSVPIDQGITGRAFQTARTQNAPDVSADPDYVSGNPTHRSEVAVPLRRGERVLGVLDVASDRLSAFNNDDVLLARSLAEAIALALDNARLYAEIRQYAADLSTLYTIAREISQSLILEDVLSETLHSALTSLGFDAGLISLAEPSGGHLYPAAEQGLPPALSNRLREEGLEGTLCVYAHNQGRAVAVGNIEQDTPIVRKLGQEMPQAISEMRSLGLSAYSSIPLLHQDRSLGSLSLFAYQPRTLSVEDEALQTAIGRQIATAVTNARLFQAIEDERSLLQALIESSRDGIILIGTDQRMLVVNAPALSLLRLTDQPKEWVNRPLQDVLSVTEHDAPRAMKMIQAEIHRTEMKDELPGEGECEIPPRTIHFLNLPVMAGSAPMGRLLVLRDITEDRLLERMRDDLVHAMVHDLRNPLTAIYGALTFLDDTITDTLSSTQRQLWEIAQENAEGMLQLIKSILEISRLENRQMPLEHTLVSLADLVTDVLDLQLPLATRKNLHLESDVPSTLPLAWADAGLIERVLQNLVGNAIKFTPSGGVVRVIVKADDSDRSRLRVSVSDTGAGIPTEIQERLFQKFVTGEQRGRGSGLGLAFCKMVLEAHGERIWVEDTSESGATFTFTLALPPMMD